MKAIQTMIRPLLTAACGFGLFLPSACLGYPDSVKPVDGFDVDRYLGKWYEIARLDHSFERGLQRGTAEYSRHEDGGIRVLNRGYHIQNKTWSEAEGRAWFVREDDEGYLKVTFFWPFYGSYVVYDLDREGYQWAAVCSSNHSYLWLLSRQPKVSKEVMTRFLDKAKESGFPTEKLIFVEHEGTAGTGSAGDS